MEKKFSVSIFFGFILALLPACSTPEALLKYPKRQMDRPFTPPLGVNIWKQSALLSFGKENGRTPATSFYYFPWFWEQSISDDFSLNWAPLPTALKYQFFSTPSSWLGMDLSLLGSPLYLFQEFNLTPALQIENRIRLSSLVALNLSLLSQLELRRAADPLHGIIAFKLAPMFQLLESVSAEPYVQLYGEFGNPRTGYLPFYPTPSTQSPSLRVPLGMQVRVLVLSQWEGTLEYRFLGIGHAQGFENHQITLSTLHFF